MRARVALMLFAAAVFFSLAAGRAEACSCMPIGPPCQAFSSAPVVFAGMVTEITTIQNRAQENSEAYVWTPVRVRFVIEQSFSGGEQGETVVATGRGGGDCGYRFQQGERYLVYAYRSREANLLTTGICTRTRPLAQAGEDLDFLRNLSAAPRGATISGEVRRYAQSAETQRSEPVGPLSEIPVTLEGEGRRLEARTDAQGRYHLSGLPPGKYRVNLTLPDELISYNMMPEVTVVDRGCAVVSFSVSDNGRISGRVTDAEGQPAARILVEIAPLRAGQARLTGTTSIETNEEGRYQFSGLPPGRYLLGVRLSGWASPNNPTAAYPRTFYPGVAEEAQAVVITVGAGEHVTERDFSLRPRFKPRIISGTAVMGDGSPAAHARIGFRDITYRTDASSYGAEADGQGHFTINAYEGLAYVVNAHINLPGGRQMHAEPVEVPATGEVEPLRLVISEPGGSCERCRNWRPRRRP